MSAIAASNIGSAVGLVESTLARSIPVALGFLSKLVGIGNIGGKIKAIIQKVRGKLDSVLDKVVARISKVVAGVLDKLPGSKKGDPTFPTKGAKEQDARTAATQPDDARSLQVKADVERDVAASLPRTVTSPRQITAPLHRISARHAARGLKALWPEFTNTKTGEFSVIAVASPPKKVGYTKAQMRFTGADFKGMGFGGVVLYATVNGQHLSKKFGPIAGEHAEALMIKYLDGHWNELFPDGERKTLTVQLSSSPCGVDESDPKCRDCAGTLRAWAQNRGVNLNVQFLGVYKGGKNEASTAALQELYEHGITLETWEVEEATAQLGRIFGGAVPPKILGSVRSKLEGARQKLEEMSGKKL